MRLVHEADIYAEWSSQAFGELKGSYYKKCFWCYVKRNRDSECLQRTIREKVSEYKCKILILLVVGKRDQTEHMVKQLKQFRICCMAQ